MTKSSLLAALGLALLALLPAAQAGGPGNPEVTDPVDDVHCFAHGQQVQCPGNDFIWNDADIYHVWVNDTAQDLLFTAEMKANPSFTKGENFFGYPNGAPGPAGGQSIPGLVYDYTMTFAVGAVNKTATFNIDSEGRYSFGGAATNATVHHGNWLTFTVPKSAFGNVHIGDLVHGLSFTAHGSDQTGGTTFEVLDRAPDANYGRDFAIANGTPLPKFFFQTITNANATVDQTFANATTGTYTFNWTQGPAAARLDFTVQGTAGMANLTIMDGSQRSILGRSAMPNASFHGNVTGAPGTWSIRLDYRSFKGAAGLVIHPIATASGGVHPPGSSSTSSAKTPGIEAGGVIGLVALAGLLRRRESNDG